MALIEPAAAEPVDLLDKGAQAVKIAELNDAKVEQAALDVVTAITFDVVAHEKTGAAQIKMDLGSGVFLADIDPDGSLSWWSFVNAASDPSR